MNGIEKKFQYDIEVERLWMASQHGCFTFLSMLPVAILIVIGFWDTASHLGLIAWFVVNRTINLARWMIFDYYHEHKEKLAVDIAKFKHLVLFVSVLHGLSWAVFIVWFLSPFDPAKFPLVSLALIIEIMGALLFWFSFLPALVAITLPITLALIYVLLMQNTQIYLISSIVVFIAFLLGFISSLKLSEALRYSLFLYFENSSLHKESEEKSLLLETALENMSQGISMTDKNDRLRMWNSKFVDLLGAAGAYVAPDVDLASILDAANPSQPTSHVANKMCLTSPDETNSSQMTAKLWSKYQLKTGQIYEVRQSELKQGGRVLTYTDITDQIKHEEALDKARKDAEQANAAKTRFLAAASHDLRQPIHALGLFFAELSDRVRNSETTQLIGQVEDAIDAINSMLNALLDVSKLDAGVVKPSIEACQLSELLARLDAEFHPLAQENNNQLIIRSTSAIVETDPIMLERMLRNLIGNALHYTANGKVLVGVRKHAKALDIQVLDTGQGIPEDQLDDIFIEFHQLHNPARDRRQGLGLGLAIVKRLARLLHHELKVTSQLNCGSCFSLTLPLAEPDAFVKFKLNESAAESANILLSGLKILVLDDDIAVRESMVGLLNRWGCEVITAASPKDANDIVASNPAKLDLIVVDYRLPDNISGIDVARHLQLSLGYPVGVLIITGDTGPERLQEAEASGYPLLHKPVHPAKLRSSLQYLLSSMASS